MNLTHKLINETILETENLKFIIKIYVIRMGLFWKQNITKQNILNN